MVKGTRTLGQLAQQVFLVFCPPSPLKLKHTITNV